MAELTAKQKLEQTLSSVGIDIKPGDDASLRAGSIVLLKSLNKIFGNGEDISNYSPDTIAAIQAGIKSKLGEDGLKNLNAIMNRDHEALGEAAPFGRQTATALATQAIFKSNPDNLANAFHQIVSLKGDKELSALISNIQSNTNFLLNGNIQSSVAFLQNPDVTFKALEALHKDQFFKDAPDAESLNALDPSVKLAQDTAYVENMIGVANPDGKWDDADRAQLKRYVGELQRHEYFGQGLSLEEKLALPEELRTLYVHERGHGPRVGDVHEDWKPHNANSTLGPQAYDNEQDGVWDFGFKLHFEQRLTLLKGQYEAGASDANGITEEEYNRYNRLTHALIDMDARGVELLSEKDRLTPAQATRNVETALQMLAPMLNAPLIEAQAKAERAERLVNANGVTSLFTTKAGDVGLEDYLSNFAAKDLLELRIPEIDKVDTRFDFASQAALQGLMKVLSSEHVLGINSAAGEEFFYTTSKGNAIKTKLTDALKLPEDKQPAFLQKMPADQRKVLKDMVEGGQLDTLIASLNVLQEHGRILNYNVIDHKGFAPITQDIAKDEIRRLEAADNPDAVKLFDTLIYSYTGGTFGLNDVLDGQNLRAGEDEALLDKGLPPTRDDEGHDEHSADNKLSAKEKHDKRLAQYFDSTKSRLKGSDAENDAFFLAMMNSFKTLPFGDHKQRDLFHASMINAFRDSEDGEAFAQAVNKAMADIQEMHGDVTMANLYNTQPSVHPKLSEFGTITSGGKTFNVDDIINAYEDFHLGNATGEERERGQPIPVDRHVFNSFRDDDGKIYVAGIDKGSMVFTIEEVTPDQLQLMNTYLHDEQIDGKNMSMQERVAYLQKNSPAFALIYPDGYGALTATMGYKDFYRHISDTSGSQFGVDRFTDIKERYGQMADNVREHAVEIDNTPLLASGTVRDARRAAHEFAAAAAETALAQPPKADRDALIPFASQIKAAGVILDTAQMELLNRYNGREDITIGKGQRHIPRIKGANIAENPDNKPMVAYYNATKNTIDVIPVSDRLAPHVATHNSGHKTIGVHMIDAELEYRRTHNIKPVFGNAAQKPDKTAPKTGVSSEFEKSGDGRALPTPVKALNEVENAEGMRTEFNRPQSTNTGGTPQATKPERVNLEAAETLDTAKPS